MNNTIQDLINLLKKEKDKTRVVGYYDKDTKKLHPWTGETFGFLGSLYIEAEEEKDTQALQ